LDFTTTPATLLIIAVTAIVSFLAFSNATLKKKFLFYPWLINKKSSESYRFFTHGLIHSDMNHLIFNMLTLFFFGPDVEKYLNRSDVFGNPKGSIIFLAFYAIGIIIAATLPYFRQKRNQYYTSLGASGAVSAALFAAILIFPLGNVWGIPSFIFGPLYLVYMVYMSKKAKDNIAHDAHFMGAIYGLIAIVLLVPNTFGNFMKQFLSFLN